MSYRALGQLPTNGHYRQFGPYPQLGADPVYASPATINDGGIRRIDPSAFATFKWSIDNTTTSDPAAGATFQEAGLGTYKLQAPVHAGGDNWMDGFLAAGYVVLFKQPAMAGTPMLEFYLTMDPSYVAKNADAKKNDSLIVIAGPEPIISAAKTMVSGGAPAPQPSPTPTPLPSVPPVGTCPPGSVGVPPVCVTVPGGGTPGGAPGGSTQPPGTQPGTPGTQAQVSSVTMPKWVLPVLIGTAVVSVLVIASRKKNTSSAPATLRSA